MVAGALCWCAQAAGWMTYTASFVLYPCGSFPAAKHNQPGAAPKHAAVVGAARPARQYQALRVHSCACRCLPVHFSCAAGPRDGGAPLSFSVRKLHLYQVGFLASGPLYQRKLVWCLLVMLPLSSASLLLDLCTVRCSVLCVTGCRVVCTPHTGRAATLPRSIIL